MHRLPENIRIQFARYEADRAQAWIEMLSEEEHQRFTDFKSAKRQKEFVTGRYVLRTLVGEWLGIDPNDVALNRDPDGALDIVGHPDLHVSLAHESMQAVAVVSTMPVGVDIERIQPRHPELHKYLLHKDEYPLYDSLDLSIPEKQILFWTIKEAVLKGMRTGLRHSAKSLHARIDFENGNAVVVPNSLASWQVSFTVRMDSYVAVAWQ